MLEALATDAPLLLYTPQEVEALVGRAAFNDPALGEVVRFLLDGWSAQLNPLGSLRARLLDAPEESVEAVEAALRSAQDLLRTQSRDALERGWGERSSVRTAEPRGRFSSSPKSFLSETNWRRADPRASTRVKWTPDRIRERVIALGRSFQAHHGFGSRSGTETGPQRKGRRSRSLKLWRSSPMRCDDSMRSGNGRVHPMTDVPHEASQRLLSWFVVEHELTACAQRCLLLCCRTRLRPACCDLKAGYLSRPH
jgi:hypothetical protein